MDRIRRVKKKVVKKRNKPIPQRISIEESEVSLFGKMKGTVHIVGDIVAPIDELWDASSATIPPPKGDGVVAV